MGQWLEKLLGFDELFGEDLVKVAYYFGLVFIVGWAIMSALSALGYLFSDFFFAIGRLLATPVIAIGAAVLWRIAAEWLINDWRRADITDTIIEGEIVTREPTEAAEDVAHEGEAGVEDDEIIDAELEKPA